MHSFVSRSWAWRKALLFMHEHQELIFVINYTEISCAPADWCSSSECGRYFWWLLLAQWCSKQVHLHLLTLPFLDGFFCWFSCVSHFNSEVIANHQNLPWKRRGLDWDLKLFIKIFCFLFWILFGHKPEACNWATYQNSKEATKRSDFSPCSPMSIVAALSQGGISMSRRILSFQHHWISIHLHNIKQNSQLMLDLTHLHPQNAFQKPYDFSAVFLGFLTPLHFAVRRGRGWGSHLSAPV